MSEVNPIRMSAMARLTMIILVSFPLYNVVCLTITLSRNEFDMIVHEEKMMLHTTTIRLGVSGITSVLVFDEVSASRSDYNLMRHEKKI